MNHRQLFLSHVGQTSDFPLMLEIDSASGVYLHNKDKSYIDLISGIGVSNIGHCHPNVIKAIKDQADKYLHLMVYGEFVESPQTKLAKALVETLDSSLDNIYFVNSGSEANEGAIKLAKRYKNRSEIISCLNAYHGSTNGALSITGNESLKSNFRPLLPDVRHIRFGVEEDLHLLSSKTACVIIEPVQGEAGVRLASESYFKALRKKCDKEGILLIFDEIQTGFGRTGKFWGHQHYNIVPDIITCAKGMGGGMPIGAFIASQKIMAVLKNNPILGHISTFGGHPVSCAASLATLDVILKEKLTETVFEKSERIKSHLQNVPKIKEIRNLGLMMAVEFESFEIVKPIIDRAIENGVLTDWFLFNDNSMRIAPPLTITFEEIDKACEIIKKSI